MLTVKFGPLPDSVPKTVHAASTGEITAWAARAVTADTLDRVLAYQQHTGRTLGVPPLLGVAVAS